MKTTYLINSYLPDGSTELVQTTAEHWHKIVEENKKLPKEKRRYFYADIIADSYPFDCIVMEVSADLFNMWSNENRNSRRNCSEKTRYSHISLELLMEEYDSCIMSSCSFEEDFVGSVIIEELRKKLSGWKPWGIAVLDMYLSGQKASVAQFLTTKYGLPQSTAYRKREEFENFAKIFLLK